MARPPTWCPPLAITLLLAGCRTDKDPAETDASGTTAQDSDGGGTSGDAGDGEGTVTDSGG